MHVSFPFQISSRGRSAQAGEDDHIRQLIEQVLFTAPGERINRPNFGTGLMGFVFAPASDETMMAAKFMVQGALQQQLSNLIQVQDVEVDSEDAALKVTVQYIILKGQRQETARFERALNPLTP